MSKQQKPFKKSGKIAGVLFFASIGLIVVGIVAVLLPPVKTSQEINLSAGQDLDFPIPVTAGEALDAELTVTSGNIHVYLFTSENYVKYQGGTWIYDWDIVGTGDFSTTELDGDTYHLVAANEGGSPATGTLSYWIDPAIDPGMATLGVAIMFAGVMWVLIIIMMIRRGEKVKIWDPRLQKYV